MIVIAINNEYRQNRFLLKKEKKQQKPYGICERQSA